jgi:hypothetical protein
VRCRNRCNWARTPFEALPRLDRAPPPLRGSDSVRHISALARAAISRAPSRQPIALCHTRRERMVPAAGNKYGDLGFSLNGQNLTDGTVGHVCNANGRCPVPTPQRPFESARSNAGPCPLADPYRPPQIVSVGGQRPFPTRVPRDALCQKGTIGGLKILRDVDRSIITGRAVNHWDCRFGRDYGVNARGYGSVITGEAPRR